MPEILITFLNIQGEFFGALALQRQDDGSGSSGYAKLKVTNGGVDGDGERTEVSALEKASLLSHFSNELPHDADDRVSGHAGKEGGAEDIGPSLPRAARGPARPPQEL